jgi:hypothetical protein
MTLAAIDLQFSFDDLLRNRRACTIDTGTGTG